MALKDEIKLILEALRDLEECVTALEETDRWDERTPAIGFEIDLSDDFDPDSSEYGRRRRR